MTVTGLIICKDFRVTFIFDDYFVMYSVRRKQNISTNWSGFIQIKAYINVILLLLELRKEHQF